MELSYALFASAADHSVDGKLFLFDADFDRFECSGVPVFIQFALIVKIVIAPEEARVSHQVDITMTAPSGASTNIYSSELQPRKRSENVLPKVGATILGQLGIRFIEVGLHWFAISIDGNDLKDLPLLISIPPAPAATAVR